MKELSIEEKAKAYDGLIERLKNLKFAYRFSPLSDTIEDIFPELKESEGERIWIIDYLSNRILNSTIIAEKESLKKAIAWLKNQGEQKHADKVELKFHEGEWLCENEPNNYARFIQILEIVNVQGKDRYRISRNIHKDEDVIESGFVEKYYYKFDIQDAKDGDVLVCKGDIKNSNGIKYERICLFKNLINAFFTLTKTSNYVEVYDIDVNIDYPDNTIPATKEQKEILFMAMKEAGYEWDAEKKELKKIEQKPDTQHSIPTMAILYRNSKKDSLLTSGLISKGSKIRKG